MWLLALAGCGGLLRGELADMKTLSAPDETPAQQLAWDLLRGDAPRHADTRGRRMQSLQLAIRYAREAWGSLPGQFGQGMAVAFEGPELGIELPEDGAVVSTLPTPHGTPMVVVRLPTGTVEAWVDTGAPFTVLSRTTADKLSVVRSTDGPPGVRFAVVPNMQVGQAELTHVRVLVMEDSALTLGDPSDPVVVDAILGWNVLRRVAMTLNGRAETLTLAESARDAKEDTLVSWEYPMVRAALGGVPLVFAVDTGSARSYLTRRGTKRLGIKLNKGMESTTDPSGRDIRAMGSLPAVVNVPMGGVEIPFSGPVFGDAKDWGPVPIDGCLGADVLKTIGSMHLDFPQTRFRVDPYE